jgi:hypothetical protein
MSGQKKEGNFSPEDGDSNFSEALVTLPASLHRAKTHNNIVIHNLSSRTQ